MIAFKTKTQSLDIALKLTQQKVEKLLKSNLGVNYSECIQITDWS